MNAANTLGYVLAYVVIDLEGQVQPSTGEEFTYIVQGWAAGLIGRGSLIAEDFAALCG